MDPTQKANSGICRTQSGSRKMDFLWGIGSEMTDAASRAISDDVRPALAQLDLNAGSEAASCWANTARTAFFCFNRLLLWMRASRRSSLLCVPSGGGCTGGTGCCRGRIRRF